MTTIQRALLVFLYFCVGYTITDIALMLVS